MHRLLPLLLGACAPEPPGGSDTGAGWTGTHDVATHGTPARATWRGVPCADPEARAQDGAFATWTSPDWAAQVPVPADPGMPLNEGWGVLVGDLDGDGALDLMLPGGGGATVWRGDGAELEPVPDAVPASFPGRPVGGVLGDVDEDGDLDAILFGAGRPALATNQGDARFTLAPLGDPAWPLDAVFSAALGDVDGDGHLDLLLPAYARVDGDDPSLAVPAGQPTRLLRGDGTGAFVDSPEALPATGNDGYPFAAALVDLDDDGDLDIYLANDFGDRGVPSRLWRNDGTGRFVDATDAAGADPGITAMGVGLGDLDGDGRPDLATTGTLEVALLETGAEPWVRTDRARGLGPDPSRGQRVAWGLDFGDVDNDGDLDLWTGYGHFPPDVGSSPDQPDALALQDDDGGFADAAPALGLDDPGMTRGGLLVDLDGDGWLDLVRRRLYDTPRVDRGRCGTAGWLGITPQREDGPVVGTRVAVAVGDRVHTGAVLAGGRSVASSAPERVHVGLGGADRADEVRITWPDGAETWLEDVPTRAWISVERLP